MCDFERTVEKVGENGSLIAYFTSKCRDCGVIFHSRTIGRMPEWEHEHEWTCEAHEALEA